MSVASEEGGAAIQVQRWASLDAGRQAAVLQRPQQALAPALRSKVLRVLAQVRADGDSTLRALTRRFDGVELDALSVSEQEFAAAEASLGTELKQAIAAARQRIEAFHAAGRVADYAIDTAPGVRCERLARPIQRVGLYIPAGSAPLPSTALMLGVPAALAGCPLRIACTPPRQPDGRADAAVLYAARLCGVQQVFKVGGAQAIAAMAYGTASVPRCDKLFGPGNAWVTAAKLEVAADPGGAAIDLPAGPSELLVIADAGARADWIAADLLSQAEHGADSQVLLLSDSAALLQRVRVELARQLQQLPRAAQAAASLSHARFILVDALEHAFAISNDYGPEHLSLALREPRRWLPQVASAGSVFLGDHAAEALGDYCSGTNHVLPTYGAARACSGVSVASFQTFMSVQEVGADGVRAIGPDALVLARAEQLEAHARAVALRLGDRP